MDSTNAIRYLKSIVRNPSEGLPDEVFYFITEMTPMVNVDLLVKDPNGRVLLAWRNDEFAGEGWHLPGGIVRFRETLETRVQKVAETEIGTRVEFDPQPIAIHQIIDPHRDTRGHFISFLYRCSLPADFHPDNQNRSPTDAGFLQWHDRCPPDLLKLHDIYRKFLP